VFHKYRREQSHGTLASTQWVHGPTISRSGSVFGRRTYLYRHKQLHRLSSAIGGALEQTLNGQRLHQTTSASPKASPATPATSRPLERYDPPLLPQQRSP
jgi:hypothetical protein